MRRLKLLLIILFSLAIALPPLCKGSGSPRVTRGGGLDMEPRSEKEISKAKELKRQAKADKKRKKKKHRQKGASVVSPSAVRNDGLKASKTSKNNKPASTYKTKEPPKQKHKHKRHKRKREKS